MLHGFLIWHVWGMCYWVVVPLGEFPYLDRCAIERCAIGHCAIRRYLCGLPVGGLECGRCASENWCFMAPDLACAIGRFQILGEFPYLGRCALGVVLLGARLCRSWVVWNM
eukprot:scaffold80060_cov75-Phaeocystis_antarctica.AAC.3